MNGLGIREGVEQIRVDDHDVRALLEQVGILAANTLAVIQVQAGREWIEFRRVLHLYASRSQVRHGLPVIRMLEVDSV